MPVSLETNRSAVHAPDSVRTASTLSDRCDGSYKHEMDILIEVLRAKLGVSWACVSVKEPSNDGRCSWSFRATASAVNRELDYAELSPDFSLGEHTIGSDLDMLVVPDTLQDDVLSRHTLVQNAPHFRFFAGVPLYNGDDAIGSLCILDHKPMESLTVAQQQEIKRAAQKVTELLKPTETNPMRKRNSCSDLAEAESSSASVAPSEQGVGQGEVIVAKLLQSEAPTQNGKRSRSNSLVRRSHSEKSIQAIMSPSLPLLLPNPGVGNTMNPDEFLVHLVSALYPHVQLEKQPALDLDGFFNPVTEEQMSRYSMEIVNAARANDLVTLKKIHSTQGPDALSCFNRFGEGLLNMACRRGFTDMVHFFLHEVHLAVRVRDDYGRTPLHDACWSPEPQLQICTWIMTQEPALFLIADKRGFTPFQYARECDWPIWRQFLVDNLEHLHKLASPEIAAIFS